MTPTQAQPEPTGFNTDGRFPNHKADMAELETRRHYEKIDLVHTRELVTELAQVTAQRDELQIRLRHADEAVLHIAKQRDDLKAAIRDALSQRSSSRLLRAAIQKAEANQP